MFAWEPDLPHAQELVVVTRLSGPGRDAEIKHACGTAIISGGHDLRIWTRRLSGERFWTADGAARTEVWNDESRFREAVVPTIMRPRPVDPEGSAQ